MKLRPPSLGETVVISGCPGAVGAALGTTSTGVPAGPRPISFIAATLQEYSPPTASPESTVENVTACSVWVTAGRPKHTGARVRAHLIQPSTLPTVASTITSLTSCHLGAAGYQIGRDHAASIIKGLRPADPDAAAPQPVWRDHKYLGRIWHLDSGRRHRVCNIGCLAAAVAIIRFDKAVVKPIVDETTDNRRSKK